jgi:hypothetical protein
MKIADEFSFAMVAVKFSSVFSSACPVRFRTKSTHRQNRRRALEQELLAVCLMHMPRQAPAGQLANSRQR